MCSWYDANASARKGETFFVPDDRFFSGAQRCYSILEPSACDAFRACEQAVLRCMCSVCGCTVYLHRAMRSALVNRLYCAGSVCGCTVSFLEFFPGNRNHHHFSVM